jgi:hypothetical protein
MKITHCPRFLSFSFFVGLTFSKMESGQNVNMKWSQFLIGSDICTQILYKYSQWCRIQCRNEDKHLGYGDGKIEIKKKNRRRKLKK